MRQVVFPALLAAGCTMSCVSDDPGDREAMLYRTYEPQPRRQPAAQSKRTTPSIRRLPSNQASHWFPRGRRISRRWTHLVVHHSATTTGGARTFDKHHRQDNGWDELGYHFVIGNGTDTPDGYVEVGPRWHKQKHGAHCKTPDNYYNEHGIGICLVGDFTTERPTARQLASLEQLTRFLGAQCGISPNRLTTHRAITRRTQCPGRHLSLARLRRSMARPATATSMP